MRVSAWVQLLADVCLYNIRICFALGIVGKRVQSVGGGGGNKLGFHRYSTCYSSLQLGNVSAVVKMVFLSSKHHSDSLYYYSYDLYSICGVAQNMALVLSSRGIC